ncbi:MAG: hypothetical protein GY847_29990 [Proteobacteria bacterium]|nr:hypothetical protein [Pseudomonadota bacterium]
MKILHIFRTEPDVLVRNFINEVSKEKESAEVPLYEEATDYDQLLEAIFESDRVISWW